MDLTPAGEMMLAHVRELLQGIERMHGEVGRFASGLKGHIRLLANSSSLNGFIIPSVSRFWPRTRRSTSIWKSGPARRSRPQWPRMRRISAYLPAI
jgi:DNA-binding transcriptional LysR family regulator